MRLLLLLPIVALLAGCTATAPVTDASTPAPIVSAPTATPTEAIDWVGSIQDLYAGCIAPLGITGLKFTKNPTGADPYGYVTGKAADGTDLDWNVAIANTGNPLNTPDATTQAKIDAAGC